MNTIDSPVNWASSKSFQGLEQKEKLKALANEFEAIFLDLVMKSMRSTVPKGEIVDGGNAEKIYSGMLDSQYAKMWASQGKLGLAESIESQLSQFISSDVSQSLLQTKRNAVAAYQASALQVEAKKVRIE